MTDYHKLLATAQARGVTRPLRHPSRAAPGGAGRADRPGGPPAEADADASLRDALAAALEANERLVRLAHELRAENARLWEELARVPYGRSVPAEPLLPEEGEAPFAAWAAKPDRTRY